MIMTLKIVIPTFICYAICISLFNVVSTAGANGDIAGQMENVLKQLNEISTKQSELQKEIFRTFSQMATCKRDTRAFGNKLSSDNKLTAEAHTQIKADVSSLRETLSEMITSCKCTRDSAGANECSEKPDLIGQYKQIKAASFVSGWFQMKSQDSELSTVELEHGLGVSPVKVDVLIKPTDGPDDGWIFHGDTAFQADDDKGEKYGGVVYLYNETHIILYAPKKSNNQASGRIVYTGSENNRRLGIGHQESNIALVMVKAWGPEDMPVPDFESDWLHVDITDSSQSFYELEHYLEDYPALVNVQVYDPVARVISEGVGASVGVTSWINAGGTVWGFNDKAVRIWSAFFLSEGRHESTYYKPVNDGDGWGNSGYVGSSSTKALVKVRVWAKGRAESRPDMSVIMVDTDEFQFGPIDNTVTVSDQDLVSCFVQATTGPNEGFRFKGYGSSQANGWGFGGSVFAYNENGTVRCWPPNPAENGFLIHIKEPYGNGSNVQLSNKAIHVCSLIKTVV